MPDISSQFAMPRTYDDQPILDTARAFHAIASTIPAENEAADHAQSTTAARVSRNFRAD